MAARKADPVGRVLNMSDDAMAELVEMFRTSVVPMTRRSGFRVYKNCLSGKDITLWLTARRYIPGGLEPKARAGAIRGLGQRLVREGLLVPVEQGADLRDDDSVLFIVSGVVAARRVAPDKGSRGSLEFLKFGKESDARQSRLRRSIDFAFKKKGGSSSNMTSPVSSCEPMSPQTSTSDTSGTQQPKSVTSPDGQALRRASLDLAMGRSMLDEEEEDDNLDLAFSFDQTDEYFPEPSSASSRKLFFKHSNNAASSSGSTAHTSKAAASTTSPRSPTRVSSMPVNPSKKRGGVPSASSRRKTFWQESRLAKELRENTLSNRGERSVLQLLAAIKHEDEQVDMATRLDRAKTATTKNPVPLLNSQYFDPAMIKKSYATGARISFYEKVTLSKLDADYQFIETIRVPIDYSIKRKLVEPKPQAYESSPESNTMLA